MKNGVIERASEVRRSRRLMGWKQFCGYLGFEGGGRNGYGGRPMLETKTVGIIQQPSELNSTILSKVCMCVCGWVSVCVPIIRQLLILIVDIYQLSSK